MIAGVDGRLPPDDEGRPLHTWGHVYRQMIWDIAMNYSSIPDPLSMSIRDIEFWYDGIRPLLRARTKPVVSRE